MVGDDTNIIFLAIHGTPAFFNSANFCNNHSPARLNVFNKVFLLTRSSIKCVQIFILF